MANPLTLVFSLKEGLDVQQLGGVLASLKPKIDEALTSIGTVHHARFIVLDPSTPNLQPGPAGPYKLAVITTYDGDFDVYIQDFVNHIGEVFDALLSFTTDGGSLVPVKDNVAAFTEYVSKNDASRNPPNSAIDQFSAYPCTVQQVLAADPCPQASPASSSST